MRREAVSRSALWLAATAVSAPAVLGQQVELRYRPPPGYRTHAVAVLTIAIDLQDGGGLTPPDVTGVVLEADVRQAVTDVVVRSGREVVVDRVVDSTRVLLRANGVQTSDPEDVGAAAAARVTLSDRFEVVDAALPPEDSVTDLVTSALRTPLGYEFALPEPTVAQGDRWTETLRYPFRLPQSGGAAVLRTDTTLVARATFAVDSLVARHRDTLAFLAVSGRFDSLTFTEPIPGAGDGRATLSGTVDGTLVWSSGAGTLHSGALHAALTLTLVVDPGGRNAAMRFGLEVVNRIEPRP